MKKKEELDYVQKVTIHYTNDAKAASLVHWLVCLTAIQEVPGSIPGYNLDIFLEV